MKKRGFTLTELLITLGIIGVAAALAAPVVTNIIPDKNKMIYMKNYKELATITQKMLNDPELYQPEYAIAGDGGYDYDGDGTIDFQPGSKYPTCVGLGCTQQPTKAGYTATEDQNGDYKDSKKYPYLLADFMGSRMQPTGNFITNDNTSWYLESLGNGEYRVTIFIDNSEADGGCSYSEECNKNCRKFIFNVDNHGNVTAGDYLGQAYLLNPVNMNDKKADYAQAKLLLDANTPKEDEEPQQ